MKVYVESAGVKRDFNWKTYSSAGTGTELKPSPTAIELLRSLSPFAQAFAIAAEETQHDGYCLAVRSVYIDPDVRDENDRPIYLNLYIEELSEEQLRSLVISYLQDELRDGLHYWPEIAQHYCRKLDDFDMQWDALIETLNNITSRMPASIITAPQPACDSLAELLKQLPRCRFSSKVGRVLHVQQIKELKINVEWDTQSATKNNTNKLEVGSLYFASLLFLGSIVMISEYGTQKQASRAPEPAAEVKPDVSMQTKQ